MHLAEEPAVALVLAAVTKPSVTGDLQPQLQIAQDTQQVSLLNFKCSNRWMYTVGPGGQPPVRSTDMPVMVQQAHQEAGRGERPVGATHAQVGGVIYGGACQYCQLLPNRRVALAGLLWMRSRPQQLHMIKGSHLQLPLQGGAL